MPIRDIVVTLAVLALLPLILRRPWIGILAWSWIGYMNPHRLAYGFAREAPFAMLIGATTLVAMLFMKEKIRFPWSRETIVLLLFVLWMCLTTVFSLQQEYSLLQLEKVVKIQVMTFITMILMLYRERLNLLVWVIVLSLGFYGVKGGIFTLMTGGGYHVMGPLGSFIGGNNELGLALIMILPLMRYLQLQRERKWQRNLFTLAMALTVIAILGTQSRGALVGLAVMAVVLIVKSRRRFTLLLLAALMVPVALTVMPESWFERMHTIQEYEEDQSAQGRINAWHFAVNLAQDRPLVGGGFEAFHWRNFRHYAPDPNDVKDAHSIYFEVLGEHGFAGLFIYLLLGFFAWRSATWVIRNTREREDLLWARDLAAMIQVSLAGYASAGAFLGLAYFDLYYHLIAMVVILRFLVRQQLQAAAEADSGAAAPAVSGRAARP
ncbi:putative O-glycosylation ligase, exosortase A system-associated [Thiohalobacter thiocyanaticus]|uniref:Putative O-glycosylation ligase, exosortase A system-associated n=1 Tax=Thiohalobacter thiocyanaticus TaxID=585455 RepID=A0A426QME8_9GAMM|nr:putative O-glycosylation ligase, exosortase A system-associated [Thiohalobacter thiocyanaticus]RRQ22836.1 putative O-glycosylation ligase, exosortase A system-associated [Thiohalobacter thiocyanaticus]